MEELKLTDFYNSKQLMLDSKAKQIFTEGNVFKKLEAEFLNSNSLKEFERKRQNDARIYLEKEKREHEEIKSKYRVINNSIQAVISKQTKEREKENIKNLIAVETRQRHYKQCVKNSLTEIFTFRGVWRNKAVYDTPHTAARAPTRLSSRVTWSF